MRVVGLHFVDRGWRIVDISWAVAEFSCADVCLHEVLHRVPQAGQHHGGRRAVNLHEYAALGVAAAENIFQVGANIFKHAYCRISCCLGWCLHCQSEVWLQPTAEV